MERLTKMDMARVVMKVLYNLPGEISEKEHPVAWKGAKRLARCKREHVEVNYELAGKILAEKVATDE
jgi:hypothetical protein